MRELIDSHLDSLLPGIYLETKGGKLGVTMEMLKRNCIEAVKKDGVNKEKYTSNEKFEELKRSIKDDV